MAQLTEDTSRGECTTPRQKVFPARALNQAGDPIVFYKGAIVCKRLGSKLVEIPEAAYPRTDLIPLGVCECQIDMTGLADSDLSVLVNPGLLRPFATGSSANEITANHVGQTWYMYDDATAYLTDNGGTLSPGGTIGMMEPSQVDAATELALYFDCEMPQVLQAIASAKQSLVLNAPSELTIAAGVVTATQSVHTIDTEADAASDNLDTISGGVANQLYLVKPASAARTVVIRDTTVGSGNIFTPNKYTISLAEATDWALMVSDGTNMTVLASSVKASDNVPYMQTTTATLVAGTATVATGIVVAANSEVIVFPTSTITGSTNFASCRELLASRVNGASGVGTVVVEALTAGGVLDSDAAGAVKIIILAPQI